MHAICLPCLGYSIIQLPALVMSSFHIVKKVLFARGAVGSNKVDAHSIERLNYKNTSTIITISQAQEDYTDLQILMANMESKTDQKINRARQELLDLMSKRFDDIRTNTWTDIN